MYNDKWSFSKRFFFLFFLSYCSLFVNSKQFFFTNLLDPIWQKVIPWFAKFLGHSTSIFYVFNGSGDTTFHYYQIFFFAIFSIFFSIIITVFDRKRNNYNTLLSWLIILLRYYLFVQMMTYGLSKLFYLQFSFPSEARLGQKLGDLSPMGLLWTFMGYSKPYTIFTGALEFIGGILLLSRKTTTLGALITFGVMINVMMLNYCYDVPVKILSTHLVLISAFLIALNGRRLISFFVTNQKVEPFIFHNVVSVKYQKPKIILKWTLIIGYLAFGIYSENKMSNERKNTTPIAIESIFRGKYIVENFTRANDSLGIYSNPKLDWKIFQQRRDGHATITMSNKQHEFFNFELDESKNLIKIKTDRESNFNEMKYEKIDDSKFHVFGKYGTDYLDMILTRKSMKDYQLIKRGFNWISEKPYNR